MEGTLEKMTFEQRRNTERGDPGVSQWKACYRLMDGTVNICFDKTLTSVGTTL